MGERHANNDEPIDPAHPWLTHGIARWAKEIAWSTTRGAGGDDIVEDIEQDTLMRMFVAARRWSPDRAKFSTFYNSFAKPRAYQSRLRLTRPRDSGEIQFPQRPGEDGGDPTDADFADLDGADPIEAAARSESRDRLVAAISQLSASDQDLIQRRFFDGLTDREIAEADGVTIQAVHQRLMRVIERLRDAIVPPPPCEVSFAIHDAPEPLAIELATPPKPTRVIRAKPDKWRDDDIDEYRLREYVAARYREHHHGGEPLPPDIKSRLDRMKPNWRAAIEAIDVHGVEAATLARRLGLSSATVRQWRYNALAALIGPNPDLSDQFWTRSARSA